MHGSVHLTLGLLVGIQRYKCSYLLLLTFSLERKSTEPTNVLWLFYLLLNSIDFQAQPIEVNVVSHPIQRYAVWFGGSVLASTAEFYEVFQIFSLYYVLQVFWKEPQNT